MFTCRTGGRARARRGGSSGLVAQWVPVGGSLVTVVERPAGMRTSGSFLAILILVVLCLVRGCAGLVGCMT